MKAVVLHEYGGPEKLKFEDNGPEPQISGSTVLIATAAASVNPIDWKLRSGMRQKDSPLSFPAILGRDVSGVVRAVGANVKHFKAGDRVLALSNATYAGLVAVDHSELTRLPDGVDLPNAAQLGAAYEFVGQSSGQIHPQLWIFAQIQSNDDSTVQLDA
jgi:NADPH:quinone reductase-like Zn-dependent oxidoreductase